MGGWSKTSLAGWILAALLAPQRAFAWGEGAGTLRVRAPQRAAFETRARGSIAETGAGGVLIEVGASGAGSSAIAITLELDFAAVGAPRTVSLHLPGPRVRYAEAETGGTRFAGEAASGEIEVGAGVRDLLVSLRATFFPVGPAGLEVGSRDWREVDLSLLFPSGPSAGAQWGVESAASGGCGGADEEWGETASGCGGVDDDHGHSGCGGAEETGAAAGWGGSSSGGSDCAEGGGSDGGDCGGGGEDAPDCAQARASRRRRPGPLRLLPYALVLLAVAIARRRLRRRRDAA